MSSNQEDDALGEIDIQLNIVDRAIARNEVYNGPNRAVVRLFIQLSDDLRRFRDYVAEGAAALDEKRRQLDQERAAFNELCKRPEAAEPDSIVAKLATQSQSISDSVGGLTRRVDGLTTGASGVVQSVDGLSQHVQGLPDKRAVEALLAAAVDGSSGLGVIKDSVHEEFGSLATSIAGHTEAVDGIKDALLKPLGDARSAFESGLEEVSRKLGSIVAPETLRTEMQAFFRGFAKEARAQLVAEVNKTVKQAAREGAERAMDKCTETARLESLRKEEEASHGVELARLNGLVESRGDELARLESLRREEEACHGVELARLNGLVESCGDEIARLESLVESHGNRIARLETRLEDIEGLCTIETDRLSSRVEEAEALAQEQGLVDRAPPPPTQMPRKRRRSDGPGVEAPGGDATATGELNVTIREMVERCNHVRIARGPSARYSLSDAAGDIVYCFAREARARKLLAFYSRGPAGPLYCAEDVVRRGEQPEEAVDSIIGCTHHGFRCMLLRVAMVDGQRTLEVCRIQAA